MPDFGDLPFRERPDLSPYLIHMTKRSQDERGDVSALDNLMNILQCAEIWGSDPEVGFIKGPNSATCFMDVPFQALKYVLTPDNADPDRPRYEPYGIVLTKTTAYIQGCRPVLYLSNEEIKQLRIPREEQWRVVRFEVTNGRWISWLHEREWRCKGNFVLPKSIQAVLVKDTNDAERLNSELYCKSKAFRCKPRSIIPLVVVSQGLLI